MGINNSFFKTQSAYNLWKKKYQFGNELPIETYQRVAKTLADVEKNPSEWYQKFLNTLVKLDPETHEPLGLKCTAGGRVTSNIGTSFDKATLMNCFVSGPVKGAKIEYDRTSRTGEIKHKIKLETDNTPDDLINIFLTVMEQAKTLASEGGYGINFDFIDGDARLFLIVHRSITCKMGASEAPSGVSR